MEAEALVLKRNICCTMYCPMDLDCRLMTGQNYGCPNAEICLNNSSKHSMVKVVFFMLNQQMCQIEDIKVNEQPLSELMQQFVQDLESLLTNLESFVVTHRRSFSDRDLAD